MLTIEYLESSNLGILGHRRMVSPWCSLSDDSDYRLSESFINNYCIYIRPEDTAYFRVEDYRNPRVNIFF